MPFTPIWGTGFEMGSIPAKAGVFEYARTGPNGVDPAVLTNPHTGTYAFMYGYGWYKSSYWQEYHAAGRSDVSVGLWQKCEGNGGQGTPLEFILTDGKIISVRAAGGSVGVYTLYVDGVAKASGVNSVDFRVYHNLQVQAVFGDAGYVKVRVDGNNDIDWSGDTKPGTSNILSRIRQNLDGSGNEYLNWYLDDYTVGYGDWAGDIRYDGMWPIADTNVHSWLQSGRSLQPTPIAPSVSIGGGSGLTGAYHYKVTLVDPLGETMASPASDLVEPADKTVHLSNIPFGIPDWTTSRKLYRTVAGGSEYKLCGTINDSSTTTYDDSLADGSLGALEPGNVLYDKIDERPANDADYIQIATNAAKQLSLLSDWWEDAKRPLFVIQWSRMLKTTADSQQAKFLLKSGEVESVSSAFDVLSSYAYYSRLVLQDPNGNIPWAHAAIEALLSGLEAVVP